MIHPFRRKRHGHRVLLDLFPGALLIPFISILLFTYIPLIKADSLISTCETIQCWEELERDELNEINRYKENALATETDHHQKAIQNIYQDKLSVEEEDLHIVDEFERHTVEMKEIRAKFETEETEVKDLYASLKEETALHDIIKAFGPEYSVEDGKRLTTQILHPLATGFNCGKTETYQDLAELITHKWARHHITYKFKSYSIKKNNRRIVELFEYVDDGTTRHSEFEFIKEEPYDWRLICYCSEIN